MDWGASITIPAALLERTPAEERQHRQLMDAAREMGPASRFYQRRLARGLGMTTLPGTRIYIGSRGGPMTPIVNPPEDLTALLPGEAEYINDCEVAEALERAGGSAP